MLNNYSFIIPDLLAGMACPGVYAPLEEDLDQLKRDGISSIITLTEYSLPSAIIHDAGFFYLHLPIADFTPPTLEQINNFTGYVAAMHRQHKGVAVHCAAGMGRTGTMLACYLVYVGQTAENAINLIRRIRPGSIETTAQEEVVYQFYKENSANGRE